MKPEEIRHHLERKELRVKHPDKKMAKKLVLSAEKNANYVISLSLTEESSTTVFRGLYESIRSLGEARLWLLGYEAEGHDVMLEALGDFEIPDKGKLNFLDKFKEIRHSANYDGFIVAVSQASQMIDLWNTAGKEILEQLKKKVM